MREGGKVVRERGREGEGEGGRVRERERCLKKTSISVQLGRYLFLQMMCISLNRCVLIPSTTYTLIETKCQHYLRMCHVHVL